ncbi:MAG: orotidine-5'-phosphate decarboxylase [Saprospiraceae bacterium]|nr:orotidine-5'-phosphate decarboxylase [Saprospiraceae bacterium]
MSTQKKELVLKLFELGVLKFGSFTLKSGLLSPFYLDFRRIIGDPNILRDISEQLWEIAKDLEFDHLCGVPYAALSISSTMSVLYGKPMIVKRKEAKKYGTKKIVEGVFEKGQKCIILDDVISSGISMIETLEALKKEGLQTTDVLAIVNRMQGGVPALESHGYRVHCVYEMDEILSVLLEYNKISKQQAEDTQEFIRNNSINFEQLRKEGVSVPSWSYRNIKLRAEHPVAKRLINIITAKRSNLCCSADVSTKRELLQLANRVGPHICMLKTHIDNIQDFDRELVIELKKIAEKHNFIILEDRKFADIGHIVKQQFTSPPFSIADWADAVTVHVIAGSSSIDALRSTGYLNNTGLIIVAEMSTQDTLTSENYTEQAIRIAENNKDVVLGVVAQNYRPESAGLMMFTPGINIDSKGDQHGQVYNPPSEAFTKRGVDVMIVGRGIYQAEDIAKKAAEYRNIGWDSYQERLN